VYTQFEQHNQDFSNKAHAAAQSLVYPKLFGCDQAMMTFESCSVSDGGHKQMLDGQMAIDRIVNVTVGGLRYPIQHTVQERFRRQSYSRYRDITITELNNSSGQKSELYKMMCDLMTYGYYDERRNCFGEVIVIDVAAFKVALSRGEISYSRKRNPKQQDFICIDFDDLHAAGVVMSHINKPKPLKRELVAISADELAEYF
jgi:hypothetical protein